METSPSDAFIADVRQYDAIEHCHSHAHHQIILPLSGALEIEIDVKIPPPATSYLTTQLPRWQYLNKSRMSWSDAEL